MDSLGKRREKLCLNTAKKCLRNEKMKQLFPLNSSSHSMNKRKKAKYKVNHARSERYKRSPVIYMQNLLNHNFVNDEICAEGGPRFEREEQDREVEGKELPCM